MLKGIITILMLVVSNCLMTLAWYGNLKFDFGRVFPKWGLFGIIIVSWGIALLEYFFMIPANRIGFQGNGGPFSMMQLKVIQETITLDPSVQGRPAQMESLRRFHLSRHGSVLCF